MITGIGYDDQYPRSNLERIVVFLSSIYVMFFLRFLIASISEGIQFNPKEKRAYLKMIKILSKEIYIIKVRINKRNFIFKKKWN